MASDSKHTSSCVSLPVRDPSLAYPPLPDHLKGLHFGLGVRPPTPEQRKEALHKTLGYMEIQKSNFLGYQINHNLDYADMSRFLNLHVNNIGDPFQDGGFTMNSKFMERPVLDYYASLWNARWPHDAKDPESYWGFCLTMGSTEANMYAMWNARDYLAGKVLLFEEVSDYSIRPSVKPPVPRLVMRQGTVGSRSSPNPNAYTPVAFYSEDTHYSFAKAMRLIAIRTFYDLAMELYKDECPLEEYRAHKTWPQEVPSEGGGGGEGHIDIDKLAILVEFFAAKGYPILLSFNYGSTFKGAYDDVEAAGRKLMPIMKKYGLDEREVHYSPDQPDLVDKRTGFWIHVDGALGATYMPFIEMAHRKGLIPDKGPCFDFRLPYVHSICMSGHKWVGAPMPCGAFMSKTKYQLSPPSRPDYIGTPDTTFAGSRNGLSPLLLWHRLSKESFEDQMHQALRNESMAAYIHESLLALEKSLDMDIYVARTKLSLTVRFRQANNDIVKKYSLSNESLTVEVDGVVDVRYYSHVFAMNHVTKATVDALIKELKQPGAFYKPPTSAAMRASLEKFPPLHSAPLVSFVPSTGRGYSG